MSNHMITNAAQDDTMKFKSEAQKTDKSCGSGAKAKADAFALSMKPVLEFLAEEGITSRTAIARALKEYGYPTARKGQWTTGRVSDMIGRLAVIKIAA